MILRALWDFDSQEVIEELFCRFPGLNGPEFCYEELMAEEQISFSILLNSS
jgi:hypothetical protein